MPRTLITAAALAILTALPASAETDIGIIGGDLRLGFSDHELEGGYVAGTVDVALTPHHGVQFDLQYEERSNGGIGRLSTVLYMTPRDGQKYGLTLMLADKNDASSTYGQVGAVGMFEVAKDVNIEVRAAGGLSADNDLDWVTVGAGLHWQVASSTRVYAQYDIAEFDEAAFGAIAHDATFGVQTQIKGSPVSLFAEASRDWLSGRDAADAETTIRAGVSISLGRKGNNQPSFRVSDPMRQILRRGLY